MFWFTKKISGENSFISDYDRQEWEIINISEETINTSISWIKHLTLDLITWVNNNTAGNKKDTSLSIIQVWWMQWDSPIFNPKCPSRKIKNTIQETLDRTFYIPQNIATTKYARHELNWGEPDINKRLERLWQTLAWYIYNKDIKTANIEYECFFEGIRRKIQTQENISEMEAYIHIYKVLSPYIGVSTFLGLTNTSWNNPSHNDFFSATQELFWNELNREFNELKVSRKAYNDFFFLRTNVICWCTDDNIKRVIYPFSD